MDSMLPIIVEMRKPFSSSGAPTSSQITVPQYSPNQSTEIATLVGDIPNDLS